MKNIFESGEIMGYHAQIDCCYYLIDEVNREVNQLMEKRDKNRDLSDDKLIVFRQQAIIIARKKDQLAEKLKETRMEHTSLDKQLKEKRKNMGDQGEVPKGEDV